MSAWVLKGISRIVSGRVSGESEEEEQEEEGTTTRNMKLEKRGRVGEGDNPPSHEDE